MKEKKRVWIKEKDLKRGKRNGGMREKTGEEGGVEAWWISKTRVKCTQDSKQGSISLIWFLKVEKEVIAKLMLIGEWYPHDIMIGKGLLYETH